MIIRKFWRGHYFQGFYEGTLYVYLIKAAQIITGDHENILMPAKLIF